VVKSFWPRVCSIYNTDIPIHLATVHRYKNAVQEELTHYIKSR
jgi:hypothetical protein